jgi:hypothetical protein
MCNGPIIRSDLAKINKERRRKIHISIVMDKMRVISIDCQLEVELIPADHDLDY